MPAPPAPSAAQGSVTRSSTCASRYSVRGLAPREWVAGLVRLGHYRGFLRLAVSVTALSISLFLGRKEGRVT